MSSCLNFSYDKNNKIQDLPLESAPSSQKTVENFALLDHEGKFHELYYYSDKKAVVLISQGNGCPIIRKSVSYLRELKEKYEPQGVVFLMINANPYDDRLSILQEAQDYKINIPILEDKSQVISEPLNIIRTAEAILIDPREWAVVYHGAIHDQFGYETQKIPIQHHYLREAMDALLQNKRIPIARTPAQGCLINFESVDPHRNYTYTDDAAPILMKKCLLCHSPGGVAPWSMDSYQKVKGWGSMIREVLRTRRMPPWHADPHYGKFKDDLSLTHGELHTIVRWVEEGFVRGEGRDPLVKAAPARNSFWSLGPPDLVFSPKEKQNIPATGEDQFRFIPVDEPIPYDIWVSAMDLEPSDVSVVHHGNVVVRMPQGKDGKNGLSKTALDAQKEELFIRSGAGMDTGQILGSYAPGGGPFVFPEGTGMFLPQGAKLELRMHYVPTGKPVTDLPQLALYLHKGRPAHILSVEVITNRSIKIPAGLKEYKVEGSHLFEEDTTLVALLPHMHYRGKSMKFTINYPDGTSEVALSVPHYKFRWQRTYVFQEPKRLPAKTRIVLEGTYDNSSQNPDNPDPVSEVTYGPGSDQEMFTGILYYIIMGD